MIKKELKDTVGLMQSSYYKARFAAEYLQTKIRYEKLSAMIDAWDKGTLNFKPTCPRSMYDQQLSCMEELLIILEKRAEIDGVCLADYEGGMTFSEAMQCLFHGEKIALPEWGGYWYLHEDGRIHAFTKDNQDVTDIWFDKYCNRKDWKIYDDVNQRQWEEFNTPTCG